MNTCHDCIHEGVCSALIEKGLPWADGTYPAEAFCMAFRNKDEWISVEERLPEDVYGKDRKQITTLVYTKNGRVSTASRMRIVKWDKTKLEWATLDTFEWSRGLRVTHWMPLPEAPKMKQN